METVSLLRVVTIFVGLSAAGICMAIIGQLSGDEVIQRVLPLMGSAMFGSALTFFLIVLTTAKKTGR